MDIRKYSSLFLYLLLIFFIPSQALSSCHLNPSTFHFQIGSMEATVIYDGPTIFADNAFSAIDESVKRAYDHLFRPSFPFEYSINVIVLDHPDGRILIDAGAFNAQVQTPALPVANLAGRLLRNLKASCIHPLSITHVLLTHGHADHVLGLIDKHGRRAFPRAEVIVPEKEHLFWSANSISFPNAGLPQVIIDQFGSAYNKSTFPYQKAGKLRLIVENGVPLPGIRLIPTPGHSPFHTSIHIRSDASELLVVGDAWVSTPDQLRNPDWSYLVEYNSTEAKESRRLLLEKVALERILVHVYHEQFPGLGYVRAQENLFDWVPIGPQKLGTLTCTKCENG